MAVGFVKNVGSATLSMAVSGSVTVPAAGVALGNFLIVRGVFDTAAGTVSVADSDGVNVYTVRVNGTTSGAAVETYVFTCPVTDALAAGATITLTTDKTSGPFVVDEWSGVGTYETATSSTGSDAVPTHTLDPTATAGLVVGLLASNAGTVTEDADSTGGDTWHTLTTALGSSRRTHAAYKIITGGDSQTYNPTFAVSQIWVDSILVAAAAASGMTGTFAMTTGTIS